MSCQKGIAKILQGVLKYNQTCKGELVPLFREILDKPAPKSIFISCVDSRVITSRIFHSEPGSFYLVRTPGNFVPKHEANDQEHSADIPAATASAIELACILHNANTIGVLGHSDCKALNVLYKMRHDLSNSENSQLKKWLLINGRDSIEKFLEFEKSGYKKMLTFSRFNSKFNAYIDPENRFEPKDKLSQINTLEQLKNANNYDFLREKLDKNYLRTYALWIDVNTSDVYMFSYNEQKFIKIDEDSYEKLYSECNINYVY